jgi:2,4-dienoyl-CoA reductase-like NADH-dependent reductase (Old Yellow Enzyme family)
MDVFTPFTLPCGLCLRNRLLRAAAFSGETVPAAAATLGEAARGGAALVTLAYTSVSSDGRTFPSQFILSPESAPPDFSSIAAAVHAAGALFSVQLTHAGSFASRSLLPPGARGPLAPSSLFDLPTLGWPTAATEGDMARLVDDFAAAAAFAVGPRGGADAVELHLGHGYFLSQWLSPAFNVRGDGHGGSAAARARFPLAVARAVRAAIGPQKALFIKLNTHDGFSGGVTPADVAHTVRALAGEAGLCDGLVPSAGWVNRNGFFMLRGAVPRRGMVAALARTSAAKAAAMALLGKWLVPELPFSPGFLMEGARAALAEARRGGVPVFAVGGFVALEAVARVLGEGFAGVQMARALIREPSLPLRWAAAAAAAAAAGGGGAEGAAPSPCSHCNRCVLAALTPAAPARCVERDVEELAAQP